MKEEIKLLRKAQKSLWDNMYPGYPFQLSIVIDLEEKSAWIDYCGRKTKLENALMLVSSKLMYVGAGAQNTSKQTSRKTKLLSNV